MGLSKQAICSSSLGKGSLAIRLSRLKGFESGLTEGYRPKVRDEQYVIDAEIAASVLWDAFQIGDINGKVIADLGCGTGILGIGALLLGAKEVYFVEKCAEALEIAKENLKSEGLLECGMGNDECRMTNDECGIKAKSKESKGNMNLGISKIAHFFNMDIGNFNKKADIVIMNPPFGTKKRHADREFLKKACRIAKTIYSFHKSETLGYIEGFLNKQGFKITRKWDFWFPLKASQRFHKRQIYRFRVSCLRANRVYI